MARWLIGIPAWGNRCINATTRIGLPSIIASLREAGADAHFIVYTDRLEAFDGLFDGHSHEFRFIPHTAGFVEFAACHREIMREALPDQYVALLNGDHLISRETFAVCERWFAEGKRLVVADGTRTLAETHPKAGSTAREINDWAFKHPHPITTDLTWPPISHWPSLLHFRDEEADIVHGFHLHPVAYVSKAELAFLDSADGDLVDCFTPEETHIVADPDEMAIAEMSPSDRVIPPLRRPNTVDDIVSWAGKTKPAHRWFFRHTIVHRGDPSRFDLTPVNDILVQLGEPPLWPRQKW